MYEYDVTETEKAVKEECNKYERCSEGCPLKVRNRYLCMDDMNGKYIYPTELVDKLFELGLLTNIQLDETDVTAVLEEVQND